MVTLTRAVAPSVLSRRELVVVILGNPLAMTTELSFSGNPFGICTSETETKSDPSTRRYFINPELATDWLSVARVHWDKES